MVPKRDYNDEVNTGVKFTVGKENITAPEGAFDKSGIAVIMKKVEPLGYNLSMPSGTQGYGSLQVTVTPTDGTQLSDLRYQISTTPDFKTYWARRGWKWRSYDTFTEKAQVPANGTITISNTLTDKTGKLLPIYEGKRFHPYYLRIFKGDSFNQEPYIYYIHTNDGNVAGERFHLLYFHFPNSEVFNRNNVTFYAWDDEDGNSYPLVKKGGDKLADEGNMGEWTWPLDEIYDASKLSGNDLTYYKEYTGKDRQQTYDVHNGINYNDVVYIGGQKISRFTVGIPNFDLRLIKFRLSYHNPYGFTQQLDAKTVDDDDFYDVALDKDGNLGIGKMYAIIGDALYDDNTWRYTTPQEDNADMNSVSTTLSGRRRPSTNTRQIPHVGPSSCLSTPTRAAACRRKAIMWRWPATPVSLSRARRSASDHRSTSGRALSRTRR